VIYFLFAILERLHLIGKVLLSRGHFQLSKATFDLL